MSSIVRASASTSWVPCAGMEEEKSPCPSRAAEARERLQRRTDPARQDERSEQRDSGQQERHEQEPADETRDRTRHLFSREPRLDEHDRLAGRSEERQACRELLARGDRGDGDVAGRERFRVHVAVSRLDELQPVRDRQQVDLDADLLRKLVGEPVVELADRHDPPAGQSRDFDECADRPALPACDHESLALFGGRIERLLPGDRRTSRSDEPRVAEQRAGIEARGLAESAQHELQLQDVSFLDEPREGRAAGEQPGGGHRVLADAANLVAGRMGRGAHLRQRLVGGLVPQQAERGERDRDDREKHHAGDREEQQPLERARPGDEAAQARLPLLGEPQRRGFPLPQQRVQVQCPPIPERHSTRVFAISVRMASIARSEATAKAATKLYSL